LISFGAELFLSLSQFSVQSPPPPRLYTYVENGALEPLLILMDVVAKGQYVIGSDDILEFERALSQVIESAQLSVPSEGFWRNYIRLERVYNAVEVDIYIYFWVVPVSIANDLCVWIDRRFVCVC
jgi:hypothetical protein